MFPSSILVIAD